MPDVRINVDDKQFRRWLRGAPKKIRFAQKNALNITAERIVRAERRAMRRVFDRPTRWVLNGMFIRKAGPNRLEASVQFKDRFSTSKAGATTEDIIWPHIQGGTRKTKRGERALASRGRMQGKRFYVPGSGARLNRFGNITKGQINKMLSGVQGQRDTQQDTRSRSQFFVGSPGGRPLGIYKRLKTKVVPMLIFTSRATYRRRFNYFGIADKAIKRWWPIAMNRAIRDELRGTGRAR